MEHRLFLKRSSLKLYTINSTPGKIYFNSTSPSSHISSPLNIKQHKSKDRACWLLQTRDIPFHNHSIEMWSNVISVIIEAKPQDMDHKHSLIFSWPPNLSYHFLLKINFPFMFFPWICTDTEEGNNLSSYRKSCRWAYQVQTEFLDCLGKWKTKINF